MNYNVKYNNEKPIIRITFEWVDNDGKINILDTTNFEEAETYLGLLNGTICLADLEP